MVLGKLISGVIRAVTWTCRRRFHADPRPELHRQGVPYVMAILHAQQVMALMYSEEGTAAMVSRSKDGELLIPILTARGVVPVRGSTRRVSGFGKGGVVALEAIKAHVRGGRPAVIAVDGPNGPRNHVHKGVAVLSRDTQAPVVVIFATVSHRWIQKSTWDRLQIPLPFARIDGYFSKPIYPQPGESAESLRLRIETTLNEMESTHDPVEAGLQGRGLPVPKPAMAVPSRSFRPVSRTWFSLRAGISLRGE